MDNNDSEARKLAEDLYQLEERLQFETSKAERALNWYVYGQTPQSFPVPKISEERISGILDNCYELYKESHTALSYINMFKSRPQETFLPSKYDEESTVREWADLFDAEYEGFSQGLPSGPLIDAIEYFERVDAIASRHNINRSYSLEPDYSSVIEVENGDQRFFEIP